MAHKPSSCASGISLLPDGLAVSVQQVFGAVVLACRSKERGEKLRQDLLDEGAKQGRTPSLEVSLKLPFLLFPMFPPLGP